MLTFERLPVRPPDWDQRIRHYDTKTLFHESCWLDHVLTIHPAGRIDYYQVRDRGQHIGYHCGLRIRKFGLPIHGSPLGGTGTNHMGPLVNANVDQRMLADGLLRLMGFRHFLHVEVSNPALDPQIMEAAGYHRYDNVTHLVELPDTEEAAWKQLKGTARNRIRKGEKNGLVVERAETQDIAHRYYEQYIEVFAKQGMATPYGPDRPRSLVEHLAPAERLLALEIRHAGESIATGLFPYDERCIYFWGATSWLKDQHLAPNELLHWHVIKFAVSRGIPAYNMCGGTSQFKNKFGGTDVPHSVYSKSAFPILQHARNWYGRRHYAQLRRATARLPSAP